MNTQYLRYVVEVEKARSITKAAQNLYMGQPNLSKAIKELESEMGVTIFRRTAKGVEPTQKGAELLSYAKIILSQLDELESLYKAPAQDSVRFSVAVPRATYASVAFADFVERFSEREHIDIQFHETNAHSAIRHLEAGEIDLGVIRYQTAYEGYIMGQVDSHHFRHELLWEFQQLLLMSASHPLAQEERVNYHQLAGYTELVHGDYQAPSLAYAQVQRDAKLPTSLKRIYIYDRGSQYNLLQRMKGSYMWASPLPPEVLEQNGLVQRICPLSCVANRDVAVYPEDGPKPLATQFLKVLRATIQRAEQAVEPAKPS